SVSQPECPRAHGRNEVCVRVNDHHPDPACQPPHDSTAKDVTGPNGEEVVENFLRQNTGHHQRIEVALVIRTEDVRTVSGQLFDPLHVQIKTVQSNHLQQA